MKVKRGMIGQKARDECMHASGRVYARSYVSPHSSHPPGVVMPKVFQSCVDAVENPCGVVHGLKKCRVTRRQSERIDVPRVLGDVLGAKRVHDVAVAERDLRDGML